MDPAPNPPPELKNEEEEDELVLCNILLLNKDEVDEVDEKGLEGFRFEKGELLLALYAINCESPERDTEPDSVSLQLDVENVVIEIEGGVRRSKNRMCQ